MRRRALVVRRQPDEVQAGLARACGLGERVDLAVERWLDVFGAPDVRRPLASARPRPAHRRRPRAPRPVAAARLHPCAPEPTDLRARQIRELCAVRVPERDQVEAVGPGLERVSLAAGEMDDAVALADLVHTDRTVSPCCHDQPVPPRTKKSSSSAASMCAGVDHMPGSNRMRFTPILRASVAAAKSVQWRGEVPELGLLGFRFVPTGDHHRILARDFCVLEVETIDERRLWWSPLDHFDRGSRAGAARLFHPRPLVTSLGPGTRSIGLPAGCRAAFFSRCLRGGEPGRPGPVCPCRRAPRSSPASAGWPGRTAS